MATDVSGGAAVATKWHLKGVGYEFCNCAPGCTCNFSGFPSSKDGSCKAAVANVISDGRCGDVDLGGVTALAILDWPKAIHDGGGKVVFVVPRLSAKTGQLLGTDLHRAAGWPALVHSRNHV